MLRRRKTRIAPNELSSGGPARSTASCGAPKDPRPGQQTDGRDPVGVEIPIPNADRGALVILEYRRIEREPNECGTKEGDRDQAQTAMRNTTEEPEQSQTFQCPSERDPFAMKLEGKNQTNKSKSAPPCQASRASPLAEFGLIKFQQREHADRGRNPKAAGSSPIHSLGKAASIAR